MRVAFIGLGNMGRPMAANVLRAGFDLAVHTRTRSKVGDLEDLGARVADSALEAARGADVVLACLASIPGSLDLFLGEGGLVAAAHPGQVLVDHATVDLETSRRIHAAALSRGVSFLDAPVSGGPGGARDATLSIMAGGEAEAFEKARPVLEAMGKTVLHMGPSGTGTATKLANQLLVSVHSVASCEALTLASRAGVDPGKLLHVLERSWGSSRMLERNAPHVRDGDFGPSPSPVRNLHKDISIIAALARELGLDLPTLEAAARVYAELVAGGKSEWDIAAAALVVGRS